MLEIDVKLKMIGQAKQVVEKAYAPYSRFKVAAVLLCADGRIFVGVNVENSSYGLTCCAERIAVFNALSAGAYGFKYMILYTPTKELTYPCGACRQVLSEFCSDLEILLLCNEKELEVSLKKLLPSRFKIEAKDEK